jgi:serine/threonine-protein kinase RsbW
MTSQPTPCEIEAEQPLFHFSVCAPGHQSSISPMVRSLMGVVNNSDVAAGKEFEIEIALREALANAVIHGCRNDRSKIVECELSRRDAGDLVIVVRDPGPGFDPTSVPSPVMGRNVYAPHGRGIYLITQLMDETWFEGGGREIHMVLKQGIRSVIVHANADDPNIRLARNATEG